METLSLQPTATIPPQLIGFPIEAFLNSAANIYDTQAIFEMQRALMAHPKRLEMVDETFKAAAADADFVKLFEEKYFPRFPTQKELEGFPKGSLGEATARHLFDNGITLDFAGVDISTFYNVEMNLVGYMNIRGIRTHDIMHAVLGLGVKPIDELALLGFQLSLFCSPFHNLILSAGLIYTIYIEPENNMYLMKQLARYFSMGQNAKFFLGYKFEENWQKPLAEVRRELGLPEVIDNSKESVIAH